MFWKFENDSVNVYWDFLWANVKSTFSFTWEKRLYVFLHTLIIYMKQCKRTMKADEWTNRVLLFSLGKTTDGFTPWRDKLSWISLFLMYFFKKIYSSLISLKAIYFSFLKKKPPRNLEYFVVDHLNFRKLTSVCFVKLDEKPHSHLFILMM